MASGGLLYYNVGDDHRRNQVEGMNIWTRHILPYYLSIVFIIIIISAGRPMFSLYADELEANVWQVGMLAVSYSILPLLLAIHVGHIIDRFGTKLPMMCGALGMSVSLFVPVFIPTLMALYVSQMILGFSQLILVVSLQNGVGSSTNSKQERDRLISRFSLFASSGMLFGPAFGGYITEHYGFGVLFLLLGLIALLPFFVTFFLPSRAGLQQKTETSEGSSRPLQLVSNLFKTSGGLGRAVAVSMLILASLDIFQVYFPLYAKGLGMGSSEVGILLSSQAGAALCIRFFIPQLVQRFGRVRILWGFMLLGAVAYGLLSFSGQFPLLLLLCMAFGLGLGICQPLTIVLTYNAAVQGRTGEALAVRLAGNRLGQFVIPFSMAGMSQIVGLGMIFTVQSLLLLFGVWLARGIKS